MSVSVCVFVRDHIFGTMRPIFINFCARYLWPWRSDTLCTSGFMDDVMFAHKPRLLDVAAHAALGLAIIPVAGQRTHGNTFRALEKVTSRVASTGAESVQVYDCLVLQLPPAGPPKPKKPPMSSARKKLRELLSRSKGNPHYFDDAD